ncbi:hypothetical protein HLPCO_000452 [Haloplasma contractile SSD-17B]|uniref:Uncharacterized protein n=2 Tax=Haloplasma TaxID=471824 RepID=U2EGP2_9MOLU|nr:hypothetical protein HLPCO_000452 [Haloplasma contractile SSD-17B]
MYVMILALLISMLVPRMKTRYDEHSLSLTTESFIADYYYAMNLSIIEYKSIYMTFYTSSHAYTLSDSSGKVYKTVTYDEIISLEYEFDYSRVIFVNGKPLADDWIQFTCGDIHKKYVFLKSGYIYEPS